MGLIPLLSIFVIFFYIFRGDAKFSTWLYRLATNRCLDIVRVKNREGDRNVSLESDGIPVEKLADSAPSPEEVAARHDTRDRVRSAIKELPENYRMALILYHYAQCSSEKTELEFLDEMLDTWSAEESPPGITDSIMSAIQNEEPSVEITVR